MEFDLEIEKLLTSPFRRLRATDSSLLSDLIEAASADELTQQVFGLVPNIFSLGPDLVGLPKLREPTLVLLQAAARHLGLDGTWLSATIDRFFELVRLRRVRMDYHLSDWPFLYHLAAWQDARQMGREQVYRTFALRFHLALRQLEKAMHKSDPPLTPVRQRDNLYRYALAIRYFLRSVRKEDVPVEDDLGIPLPQVIVERAFQEPAPSRRTRRARVRTLEGHRSRCLALAQEVPSITPRRRARQTRQWQPLAIGSDVRSYLEQDADRETVFALRLPEDAAQEGEGPWDWSQQVEVPRSPGWWLTGPSRMAVATSLATPWDPEVLQPAELSSLYRRLLPYPPEVLPVTNLSFALAILSLLHLGLDLAEVLAMSVVKHQEPDASSWTLDPEQLLVSHGLPRDLLGYREAFPFDPQAHLPGGPKVSLPLPPLLARLVKVYWSWRKTQANTRPFLLQGNLEGIYPLTLTEVEAHLQALAPGVTPRRLRKTFEALYVSAGLEPILAALISNRFPFAVRATAFYTNVRTDTLTAAYLRAHRHVHQLVLDSIGTPLPWLLDQSEAVATPADRIGSRLVPRIDQVREFFEKLLDLLKTPLPPDPDLLCQGHNLFVIYVALVLYWAAAVRPRRDPLLNRSTLQGRPGWVIIADKHNRRFSESRPVPLCATAWALLEALNQGLERLRAYLLGEGYFLEYDGNQLFAVIEADKNKGKMQPLNLATIRKVLEREKLEYHWALNAARHYWISKSLEQGWLADIEPFLGHIHGGIEPWGTFSLAELDRWGEIFRQRAEEILRQLGVQVLPHPAT